MRGEVGETWKRQYACAEITARFRDCNSHGGNPFFFNSRAMSSFSWGFGSTDKYSSG